MRTLAYDGDTVIPEHSTDAGGDAQNVACLVWGADLTAFVRRRAVRSALREQAMAALRVSREYPALKHLVLAYRCPAQLRRRLQRAAHSESRRLHAELELKRAHYIDVVVLDITDLDDDRLVERRLKELADTSAGIAGYASIRWENLQRESIHDVCTRDVV